MGIFFVRIRIFFVRLCTDFAHVVRLLCTYTDFFAHWASFAYIYGFLCALKVWIIQSWGFFGLLKVSMIWYWGFFDLLKVRANSCDDWTVWRIQSSGLCWVLYLTICTRLDRLEDPIFRVPLSYLSYDMHAIHRPILPDRVLIQRYSWDSPYNFTS